MKTALKNILFPVLSAVLLIVVEKVVEKLMEESKPDKAGPDDLGRQTSGAVAERG